MHLRPDDNVGTPTDVFNRRVHEPPRGLLITNWSPKLGDTSRQPSGAVVVSIHRHMIFRQVSLNLIALLKVHRAPQRSSRSSKVIGRDSSQVLNWSR